MFHVDHLGSGIKDRFHAKCMSAGEDAGWFRVTRGGCFAASSKTGTLRASCAENGAVVFPPLAFALRCDLPAALRAQTKQEMEKGACTSTGAKRGPAASRRLWRVFCAEVYATMLSLRAACFL